MGRCQLVTQIYVTNWQLGKMSVGDIKSLPRPWLRLVRSLGLGLNQSLGLGRDFMPPTDNVINWRSLLTLSVGDIDLYHKIFDDEICLFFELLHFKIVFSNYIFMRCQLDLQTSVNWQLPPQFLFIFEINTTKLACASQTCHCKFYLPPNIS